MQALVAAAPALGATDSDSLKLLLRVMDATLSGELPQFGRDRKCISHTLLLGSTLA